MNDLDRESIFNSMAYETSSTPSYRTPTQRGLDWERYFYSRKFPRPPKIKQNHIKNQCEATQRCRIRLIELLGGVCSNPKCQVQGKYNLASLQIDHIHGDGNKERKKGLNGLKFYNYYLNNPKLAKERLQVLCANCNWIKRYDKKESNNGIRHYDYEKLWNISQS